MNKTLFEKYKNDIIKDPNMSDDLVIFWDNDLNCFGISRSKVARDINEFKSCFYTSEENFYNDKSKNFFDFLFLEKQDKFDGAFRFLVLDFEIKNADVINEIISLVEDALGDIRVIRLKGKLVIFYFSKHDFDFLSIYNTINDDFAISFQLFEGCKVNSREDFFFIFGLYMNYYRQCNPRYIKMSDLILVIQKHSPEYLKSLRQIILNEILKDYQMVNLIDSLFQNNLNISQTANVVYMHRNTINNKLEIIKDETNLSIQEFQDAMAMYALIHAK